MMLGIVVKGHHDVVNLTCFQVNEVVIGQILDAGFVRSQVETISGARINPYTVLAVRYGNRFAL